MLHRYDTQNWIGYYSPTYSAISSNVNNEMASLHEHCFLLIVVSHTKSKYYLTHYVELMRTSCMKLDFKLLDI